MTPVVVPLALCLLAVPSCAQRTASLAIDLASPQGPMLHGATGWLYGLAAPGAPDESILAPLGPQIAAQKPPDGLQHPAGDALLVAPGYRAAGGKEIQIYIQDIYPDWPYNQLGIDDYLAKIRTVVRRVEDSGDPAFFVYVPFNEPDNNWYGYSGDALRSFLADWKAAFQAIRSIDGKARIAGPNFEHFKPDTYRQFLVFARDNRVLPDELTWHELHDDFFTDWYARYASYRQIETELGIAPLPIVINEYARAKGDLAVPGNLIQWIARFATSGVQACLAFWTPSGTLSDLVARSWSNRPTGAWWLYRWYGELTGSRLSVAGLDPNAAGLQAIASYDDSNKQARILFGGKDGVVKIGIGGLGSVPELSPEAHISLWRIDSSGIEPSSGPQLLSSENRVVSAGTVSLEVEQADADSAYYAIVSPAFDQPAATGRDTYLAAYATLSGNAALSYSGRAARAAARGKDRDGAVEFIVQTPQDGFYRLGLRSARPAHFTARDLIFSLNGKELVSPGALLLSSDEVVATAFLPAGINRIRFSTGLGIAIDALDVAAAPGRIAAYEAQRASSGGTLVFQNVMAPKSGEYNLIVIYANNERARGGQIEAAAEVAANDAPAKRCYFKNTFGDEVFRSRVVSIQLAEGENTIRIRSSGASSLPRIVKIEIAAEIEGDAGEDRRARP